MPVFGVFWGLKSLINRSLTSNFLVYAFGIRKDIFNVQYPTFNIGGIKQPVFLYDAMHNWHRAAFTVETWQSYHRRIALPRGVRGRLFERGDYLILRTRARKTCKNQILSILQCFNGNNQINFIIYWFVNECNWFLISVQRCRFLGYFGVLSHW